MLFLHRGPALMRGGHLIHEHRCLPELPLQGKRCPT